MKRFLSLLIDTLLPTHCLSCNDMIASGHWCVACEISVRPLSDDHGEILAGFIYLGAIAETIRQIKFGPNEAKARQLSRFFETSFVKLPVFHVLKAKQLDAVSFVPCHWKRRISRGFDLPPLLAKPLASLLRLPIVDSLHCNRADPPLSGSQSRSERQRLVQDRYRATSKVSGKTILLVDDITTTGSTLLEAKKALETQNAQVIPFAFARTPQYFKNEV